MSTGTRPRVSVVVPFKGEDAAARRLLDVLEAIDVSEGDELLAIDNTRDGKLATAGEGRRVRVIRAAEEASSYYARNVGASEARGEWILFLDADCRPPHNLLERFFAEEIEADRGAVAGEIVGAADQDAAIARYARERGHLRQSDGLQSSFRPFAVTANLLARRAAWSDVGGFAEGVRSGGDQDFCWRLQEAGWTIGYRPGAVVEHINRESVADLMRQWMRYGAGAAWLNRQYPGAYPFPWRTWSRVPRQLVAALRSTIVGQREKAAFIILDALVNAAYTFGFLRSNRARRAFSNHNLRHGSE